MSVGKEQKGSILKSVLFILLDFVSHVFFFQIVKVAGLLDTTYQLEKNKEERALYFTELCQSCLLLPDSKGQYATWF